MGHPSPFALSVVRPYASLNATESPADNTLAFSPTWGAATKCDNSEAEFYPVVLARQERQLQKLWDNHAAVAFAILSLAIAFGLIAYTMLEPHPSFWVGSLLLVLTFAFLVAAWWTFFRRGWLLSVLLSAAVFIFLEFQFHRHQEMNVVEDVQKELLLTIFPSRSDDVLKADFRLTNSSDHRVTRTALRCVFNRVCAANHMCVDRVRGSIEHSQEIALDPHGDAETNQCAARGFGGQPLTCVDMTIFANYALNDISGLNDAKQWRFTTHVDEGTLVWDQQPIQARLDEYCGVQ